MDKYGTVGVFNDILPIRRQALWGMPIFPMQIGILLEVLCFSLGLAYRNRSLAFNTQKALRLERDLKEAELKALRAQLTPHFYGHCLDSIKGLIKNGGIERAAEYLEDFERLLRLTLEHSEKQSVCLKDELEFARIYLKMEGLRFKDNYAYQIVTDPHIDTSFYQLPPMLLQPFLENAAWHALPLAWGGKVSIFVELMANGVQCIIEDNGVGRKAARENAPSYPVKRTSFGIKLTEERIQAFNELKGVQLTARIIFLLLLFPVFLSAQTIERDVLANAGGTAILPNNYTVSWTLGEAFVATRYAPDCVVILTEGFQQGEADSNFVCNLTPQAKLHVNGDIRGKIIIVEGNDRAERFLTTTGQPIPPGTVVVFDETQPGKIRPCTTAYDRKRTGVVSDLSGTGKYRSGIVHEQENTKEGSPVALDGTVEVLAVGPIAVGDYLTTSRVPGHAMQAKNRDKSYGTVLGQAITPLARGERGKVEMMVERR